MNIDDYKDLVIGSNTFQMEVARERLTLLEYVVKNPFDERIAAIIDWDGEKDLSTACNPYWDLVHGLWTSVSTKDFNSSHTSHANAQFLAEMILWIDSENRERAAQRKRDKIEKLKKELAELEERRQDS